MKYILTTVFHDEPMFIPAVPVDAKLEQEFVIMTGIDKTGFEQLAEVINMPTQIECYETISDIAKLAMLAYFAGSRDACGWIKKEPIKIEE